MAAHDLEHRLDENGSFQSKIFTPIKEGLFGLLPTQLREFLFPTRFNGIYDIYTSNEALVEVLSGVGLAFLVVGLTFIGNNKTKDQL